MKKDQIRLIAKEKGERYYVPEKPCAKGHYLRATSGGGCIECRKAAEKRRYYANPEKTKAKVKKKYQANAEKLRYKRREYYKTNADNEKPKALLRAREWRKLNPNHVGVKVAKKKWKVNNPSKVQADSNKRRVSKINRTPKWVDSEMLWLIQEVYDLAILRTNMFGFSWHVDHIIPLQGALVSGLHVPENLQVIPWLDNVKKTNKFEVA